MMAQAMVAPAVTPPPVKPHRRRRAAAVPEVPTADLWTLAFSPMAGLQRSGQLPAAIAELLRYARFNGGLDVVGVRIAVQPSGDGSPVEKRVARTLKHALRTCGLRCVNVQGRGPRRQEKPGRLR